MEDKINYYLQSLLSELKNMISNEVFSSVQKAIRDTNTQSNSGSEILTIDEVVAQFKISKSHINNLRNRHEDFPIIKIDKAIRFDREELKDFFRKMSSDNTEVK